MEQGSKRRTRVVLIGAVAGFVSIGLALFILATWDEIRNWGGLAAAVTALLLALAPAAIALWWARPPRIRFADGAEAEAEAAYDQWQAQRAREH